MKHSDQEDIDNYYSAEDLWKHFRFTTNKIASLIRRCGFPQATMKRLSKVKLASRGTQYARPSKRYWLKDIVDQFMKEHPEHLVKE